MRVSCNAHRTGSLDRALLGWGLFLLALSAFGQGGEGSRELAFVLRPGAPSSDDAGAYSNVVEDAIEVVLRRNDIVSTTGGAEDGETVLLWEYTVLSLVPRLHLAITVTDQNHGVIVASATNRARANLTLYNSVDELIEGVLLRVYRYYDNAGPEDSGVPSIPIALAMTLPMPPTTEDTVVVQPSAPLGDPGDTILVASGITLTGLISRPEAYDREFEIGSTADSPLQSVSPEGVPIPEPVRPLGLQLHYSYPRMTGAGIGVRYSVVPDRLYAAQEADLHFSMPESSDASMVAHLEGRILAGAVIVGHPRGRFQLELSTGVGGVVTTFASGEIPPYYDWYWNVGNLGAVLRTGRQRWFIRSGLNYGFETDRGFFFDGLNEDYFNPQLFVGTIRSW